MVLFILAVAGFVAGSKLGSVLNLMKEKTALSSIVRQDVALRKKGNEFVGNCPFHSEKTGSFFVNDDKGTFYCFGCGASGDVIEYLMRKRGIQFMQAVEVLAEISGVKLPDLDERMTDFGNQRQVLQKALEFFRRSLADNAEAKAYCHERGITDELLEKFSIGYAAKFGDALLSFLKKSHFTVDDIVNSGIFIQADGRLICRFRDRIMFPVFDKKGWAIAFGGRALHRDVNPKYLNSPESEIFQKREVLYGYNLAVKNVAKDKPFVIVEGYMDVVMMHKFGFETAVASMGTAFSSQHLLKIWKYCDEPVMCLDGDKAGHNAMIKAAFLAMPYLQPGKSLKFCAIPGDDDPDSFLKSHPKSDMDKLLTEADTLVDFIWKHFSDEYTSLSTKTPENIANWKKQIYDRLNEIQHTDIKALYKRDIKDRIYETLRAISQRKSRGVTDAQRPTKSSYDATGLSLQVNKSEKTLLREAVLLCILTMRPSVISAVVEELVSVEFSQENFGKLRDYMITELDCPTPDDTSFTGTLQAVHRTADGYCRCSNATDEEIEAFWRSVFEFGVSRKLAVNDFKVAKSECVNSLDEAKWDRLKALKLELLNKKD